MLVISDKTKEFIENNEKHVVMPVLRAIARVATALLNNRPVCLVDVVNGVPTHPFSQTTADSVGPNDSVVLLEEQYIDWTGHPNAHNTALINAVAAFHAVDFHMFMDLFGTCFVKDADGNYVTFDGKLSVYNPDQLRIDHVNFMNELLAISISLQDEFDVLRADTTTYVGIAEMGVGDLHERTFTNKSAYLMLMRLVRDVPLKAEDTDDLFNSLEPEINLLEAETDWPQFWPVKIEKELPEGCDPMVENYMGTNTDGDYVIAVSPETLSRYAMM